jgi:hypothetical protein
LVTVGCSYVIKLLSFRLMDWDGHAPLLR